MTLHVAMISDSVETLYTKTGMGNYTINFDTQEIVMVGYQNEIKVSKIVKMIPTKSLVNVDAEFEGKYYNFVVSENIDGKMSLIIQNFEKEGNDLIYNCFLNLDDLKKENVTIPHPDGNLLIKLPVDFDSSKPLRVKSKGFKNNGFGDLFIRLYVKFRRTP
jgi:hypothetical protein